MLLLVDWLLPESLPEDEADEGASEVSDDSDVDALELEEDDCEVDGSGDASGVLDDGTAAGVGSIKRAVVSACWAAPAAN